MVEVVNLKTCKDWGKPGDVRIDRQTPYGNPFIMRSHTLSERHRVIEAFREWVSTQSTFYTPELLMAKRLGCWCAPMPCHGDVIVSGIELRRKVLCGELK